MIKKKEITCLSIQEPFATWIAKGYKRIETRGYSAWKKYIGKEVYIHASSKFWKDLTEEQKKFMLQYPEKYKPGYIIAKGILKESLPYKELSLTGQERQLGFYGEGRWGWCFENVKLLDEPIKASGQLGFWKFEIEEEV